MNGEVSLPRSFAQDLAAVAAEFASLEDAEADALGGALEDRVTTLRDWKSLLAQVRQQWRDAAYVVVRGLESADPVGLLVISLLVGHGFKPYRGGRVVKSFTMSPWTRSLSHTSDEGHFHTDLNTVPIPPRVTAIQCVRPDPSSPLAGELRVVSVERLLVALEQRVDVRALAFLKDERTAAVSDTDQGCWRGHLVDGNEIRFHPETLRAARMRLAEGPGDLEDVLANIKDAALEASTPIHLSVGDVLLVANRRALHYRGACTVRFRSFPREFESRSVHVLHLMNERA